MKDGLMKWRWEGGVRDHHSNLLWPVSEDSGNRNKKRDTIQWKVESVWRLFIFTLFFILKCFSFIEEKRQCVVPLVYAFTGCFLHVPWLGSNLQPWCVGMALQLNDLPGQGKSPHLETS